MVDLWLQLGDVQLGGVMRLPSEKRTVISYDNKTPEEIYKEILSGLEKELG